MNYFNDRFLKRIAVFVIPMFVLIGSLFYIQSMTEYFKQSIFDHCFDEAVKTTKVFMRLVEEQKQYVDDRLVLKMLKTRVELYDEEYAINSLMLDSENNVVTTRFVGDNFCDPFTSPLDSTPMLDALAGVSRSGYFPLTCLNAAGEEDTCKWYYQRVIIGTKEYCVLFGLQPVIVSSVVDVHKIHLPVFVFGILLVVALYVACYYALKCNELEEGKEGGCCDDRDQLD